MFGIKRHWNNAIKGGQWQSRIKAELRNYDESKFDSIPISTSGVTDPFDVIETIFCVEDSDNNGGALTVLFPRTLQNLRVQCYLMGGDAVINAQFEHRSAVGDTLFGGKKQVIEIFAYGTVIKYRTSQSKNISDTSPAFAQPLNSSIEQSYPTDGANRISNSVKWRTLIEVDSELYDAFNAIKKIDEKVADQFAEKYITLNDKKYLHSLTEKSLELAQQSMIAKEQAERLEFERRESLVAKLKDLIEKNYNKDPVNKFMVKEIYKYEGPEKFFDEQGNEDNDCAVIEYFNGRKALVRKNLPTIRSFLTD